MRIFTLNLATCPGNRLSDASKLTRKFQRLKTKVINEWVYDILNTNNLTFLELVELKLKKTSLTDIFIAASNLKTLILNRVKIEEEAETDTVPVELKKLKDLTMKKSDLSILGLISTPSLTMFYSDTEDCIIRKRSHYIDMNGRARHFDRIRKEEDVTNWEAIFLKKQTRLEDLSLIHGSAENFCIGNDHKNYQFQLKRLRFDIADHDECEDKRIEFLRSQKNYIEELKIWCHKISMASVSLIYSMPMLTKLDVTKILPEDFGEGNYGLCQTELDDLKMYFYPEVLVDIVRIFPTLKALQIAAGNDEDDSFIHFVQSRYPEMESIKLPARLPTTSIQSTFPNLKELFIAEVIYEEPFNHFLRQHAGTLERLTIESIKEDKFSRSSTIDAIKFCKKLNFISFGTNSPMVTRMFKKIKRDFPWTLVTNINGFPGRIVFRFPDDDAIWQDKCTTWDDELIRDFESVKNYGLNVFINKFK